MFSFLLLTCLVLLPNSIARGDTLTLKEGGTYEGRVIEKTNDYVIFEINSGGMISSLKVELNRIDSLTSSPPESAQLAETFRQKWSAAQEANTAAALAEVGQWAQDNKLYDKAAEAFLQARQLAPDQDANYGFSAAHNLALANNLRPARALLKDLAGKHADDGRIAGELARLDQQAQKQVDQMLRQALDAYKKGDVRQAVSTMESLPRLDLDDLAAKADIASNQQAGMSFGRLLADARLHQTCPNCGTKVQSGLVACGTCNGSGRVPRTRVETETTKDPKTGIEQHRTYQVDYQAVCPTCKGFTASLCPVCKGAGVDLGTVGPIERPFVVEGLHKRIEALFDKLGPAAADPSSLHPINLEVVHLQACRLRYYMQQYVTLNADLAGADLTTMADRRMQVDNLLKHTSTLYRNRDLTEYQKIIEAQLREVARRQMLTAEDFVFRDPPEVSSKPPARP